MRLNLDALAVALLFFTPSVAHPQPLAAELSTREESTLGSRGIFADVSHLWKRKGGGGGGGKGGGSSSSGSSSSGSSSSAGKGGSSSSSAGKGGSSSSSAGKGGSSSSSAGKGSPSANTGGSTKTGSGVTPAFGGGRYYGGGATAPYAAGVHSPLGIVPVYLGVAALSVLPGLWLYGAYSYPYNHPYTFYNASATRNSTNTAVAERAEPALILRDGTGANQTKPVTCLCAAYAECGCDDNGNTTFLDSLIGDGNYAALNKSLVTVADVNGTSTILLNGTLPNGTTSSGGTENANVGEGMRQLMEQSGYWVMIALVGCTVWLV
ncbi:hypothetical protein B7494_g1543 [Chlorociboria aeruginascens]|nr:hypothetical protein B7494_g1543 [Chlorociboria aeruginascens]